LRQLCLQDKLKVVEKLRHFCYAPRVASAIPKDAHVMIIGAMRCGTSSLYSYLKDHPEICPCKTKEPEFFSDRQKHGVHVRNYNELWNFDRRVHRYALEASTGYTKFPMEKNVPANIRAYGIRPKFIYIIRHPFDRLLSHLNFVQSGKSKKPSPKDMHMLSVSNYYLQLEQYRPYFAREDFLILDFDELRCRPAALLQTIYAFLGISADYLPKKFEVLNQTPQRSRIFSRGSPAARSLSPEERAFIHDKLRDDMTRLYLDYGFNTGKWGYDTAITPPVHPEQGLFKCS